jgi:hypothetical protein
VKALLIVVAIVISWPRVAARAQAILTMPGKSVEVIGLKRWTIPMIQDSMAKYAPGESLASHACAAVLRYKLGFADASAITYEMYVGSIRSDTTEQTVVTVVEPQDSARVHYRYVPLDTTGPYRPWRWAVDVVGSRPGVVQVALVSYRRWRKDSTHNTLPTWARPDSVAILAYWRFMASHARQADYRTASQVLLHDRNYRNRVVAVSILANFVDRDATLHTLVEAVLEADGMVKSMAATVLERVTNEAPRPVDWRPAHSGLHAILDGTSLFQFPTTMRLLLATGADTTLAKPLLANGGEMVLAYLGAHHALSRETAHKLLIALAGRDLGEDVIAWRQWIATL